MKTKKEILKRIEDIKTFLPYLQYLPKDLINNYVIDTLEWIIEEDEIEKMGDKILCPNCKSEEVKYDYISSSTFEKFYNGTTHSKHKNFNYWYCKKCGVMFKRN